MNVSSEIKSALEKHLLWLENKDGGERFTSADLRSADLRSADLRSADLRSANLRSANLRSADLSSANLSSANLSYADLSSANLSSADLSNANLRSADLSSANLSSANLSYANLSGAKNMLSAINYLEANFDRTDNGYIVYKTFGGQYATPATWDIKEDSILTETVNPDRCTECGSGINVAPLAWVKGRYKGDVWKCLIEWAWLPGVVVPSGTDGKIRCERVRLIEKVKEG